MEGEENISDDGRVSHDEHEALAMIQFTRTIGASPDPATISDGSVTKTPRFRVLEVPWRNGFKVSITRLFFNFDKFLAYHI